MKLVQWKEYFISIVDIDNWVLYHQSISSHTMHLCVCSWWGIKWFDSNILSDYMRKNYCEQPLKHVDMRLHSNSPLDKTCMVLPGRERLVSLSDRAHLPYTEAVFREAMRIFPVLPMAFPGATSCDVEIRKFLKPKNGGSQYIDGLGQDCSNPSVLAMDILQLCTKRLI